MSEKYVVKHTAFGSRVYTAHDDGSVSSIPPLAEDSKKLFILSTDPSNYTEGRVFNTLEEATEAQTAMDYLFELHYPNLEKGTLPTAIFAWNEDKKIRIM